MKNSMELMKDFKTNYKTMIFFIIITLYGILNINKISEFLYFNF